MDLALGHVSQVSNFWFSSHNFGEVATIHKFQNGAAMLDDMACHHVTSHENQELHTFSTIGCRLNLALPNIRTELASKSLTLML